VRQVFAARPDGGVRFPRGRPKVSQDIFSGFRKYTEIRAAIPAIFAIPHSDPPWLATAKDDVREKYKPSINSSARLRRNRCSERGVFNASGLCTVSA
jgi:hypothetical protein